MTVLQVCAYAANYGGNFIASLTALDKHLTNQGVETQYIFPIAAKEKPFTIATPILTPVNEPGPFEIAKPSISSILSKADFSEFSIIGRSVSL